MHESVLAFGHGVLKPEMVTGKRVLEVGSFNVNGSLRSHVEALKPAYYVGIDIREGPGVDRVATAVEMDAEEFDPFDLIICTEMLEHAENWRADVQSMKSLLSSDGWLLVTTRSKGFPLHEYPADHWRFSLEDFRRIFADFHSAECKTDPQAPGVFFFGCKVSGTAVDLNAIEPYSMAPQPLPLKPLFSVIHPSARPDKWQAIYAAWLNAAADRDFEYILVFDKRWGFETLPPALNGERFRAVWNTGRRCYVDAVNIGAQYATGDVLIVNADDQFPCEGWDVKLAEVLADSGKEVVEVSTGTPQEHERGILVMPVLTRARYERLGFVFYPAYESMFADNDCCETARRDNQLADGRHLMFPHRHPFFDVTVETDPAYAAQNRPEAYQLGGQVLAARRASNFGNPRKKRIVVCLPGERFSGAWVSHMLLTMNWLNTHFEVVDAPMGYSSNVYYTRHVLAVAALAHEADYVLWIDDDNLVDAEHVARLVDDLEHTPELAAVAGWCLCGSDAYESPVIKTSVGMFEGSRAESLSVEDLRAATALVKIDWTGFPVVLMRQSALRQLATPFSPMPNPDNFYGFDSEDISFSRRLKAAGLNMAVDPRVKVPHLKLRDADTTPAVAGILKGEK